MSSSKLNKFLNIFDWDFGKMTIKQGIARKVVITIKNVGGVSWDWIFSISNDTELEIEPWADPGEPT